MSPKRQSLRRLLSLSRLPSSLKAEDVLEILKSDANLVMKKNRRYTSLNAVIVRNLFPPIFSELINHPP